MILGLLAGLARGGKFDNISIAHFNRPWLVLAGLAVQAGGGLYDSTIDPGLRDSVAGVIVMAASYLLLVAFIAANLSRRGAILMGAGLIMNLVVIVANRGMPVSLEAASAAGFDPSDYLQSAVKHRVMGPGTRLEFLGDVIPLPILKRVVSPGDVVLGVGMFLLIEQMVRYQPKRFRWGGGDHRREEASESPET